MQKNVVGTSMSDIGMFIYRRLVLRTSLCTIYIYMLGLESLFMKTCLLLKLLTF